jgi:hypothetical protein
MVSVAWKLSTIEKWCQDQSCLFQQGDYRNKGHSPKKLFYIQVPVKMLGLGIIFACDIQCYMSNDLAYWKLSGNKD